MGFDPIVTSKGKSMFPIHGMVVFPLISQTNRHISINSMKKIFELLLNKSLCFKYGLVNRFIANIVYSLMSLNSILNYYIQLGTLLE